MVLLSKQPLYIFMIPMWLLNGRANLKRQIALRTIVNPETLPFHQEFLEYLRAEHKAGRYLVLATAADLRLASAVAEHVGIFSEVLATDANNNLKGARKRAVLEGRFGERGYDYAGNSSADVEVWRGANIAIVVNAPGSVSRRAATVSTVGRTFSPSRPKRWTIYLRAMRVHQWMKNLLIFLPVLTSHQILNPTILLTSTLAMLAFSVCASSVYILNDLLDLPSDRLHAVKRRRPFAQGDLSIPFGFVLIVGLLTTCAGIALFLPAAFQATLLTYYILTLAYSFSLKRKLLVDVFTLGGLYVIRVLAGSAATHIEPSAWLLAFCLFFFLSLALLKRFTEVRNLKDTADRKIVGRGYNTSDEQALGALGTSSGFMCVLVLALYLNSPQVLPLYQVPWMLWFLCPLFLYWISRVWIFAYRGKIDEDPVLFAIKDRVSYIVGCFCLAILALASRGIMFLR